MASEARQLIYDIEVLRGGFGELMEKLVRVRAYSRPHHVAPCVGFLA
jgi:hypothetical protein